MTGPLDTPGEDPPGAPVATRRLDLVVVTRAWMAAFLAGLPRPDLGFADPHDFLAGRPDLVARRAAQIDADPGVEPWLLRAVVLRADGAAVGYVNFHDAPDADGVVEIGYTVLAAFRRRGIAAEAAAGMWAWAAHRGARTFQAAVAPDNVASLALVAAAGFVQVGEQVDEEDGLELVFRRSAAGLAG